MKTIAILTPISDRNYFLSHFKTYSESLLKAVNRVSWWNETVFEFVFGVVDKSFDEKELRHKFEKVFCDVNNVTFKVVYTQKCPGRFEILKNTPDTFDFITFIDFDDEVSVYYFEAFLESLKDYSKKFEMFGTPQITMCKAVRKYGERILPKAYLCWEKKDSESRQEYLVRGGYGNVVWGRFFSADVVELLLDKYMNCDLDRTGFGEEYCLHHALFFTAWKPINFCDSLYLWNYGNKNTISKNINASEALDNIEKSMEYTSFQSEHGDPAEASEMWMSLKERYEDLLHSCIEDIPNTRNPQSDLF